MVLEEQDEWISKKADSLGVDKSFIVRRALSYYRDKGINQDKILRKIASDEV